jgi:hypothetical protein
MAEGSWHDGCACHLDFRLETNICGNGFGLGAIRRIATEYFGRLASLPDDVWQVAPGLSTARRSGASLVCGGTTGIQAGYNCIGSEIPNLWWMSE